MFLEGVGPSIPAAIPLPAAKPPTIPSRSGTPEPGRSHMKQKGGMSWMAAKGQHELQPPFSPV